MGLKEGHECQQQSRPSLTLDGLGVLLDLTLSHSGRHIPHDDFPMDVGRSQAQGVRRADVMVVIFSSPLDLASRRKRVRETLALDEIKHVCPVLEPSAPTSLCIYSSSFPPCSSPNFLCAYLRLRGPWKEDFRDPPQSPTARPHAAPGLPTVITHGSLITPYCAFIFLARQELLDGFHLSLLGTC